MAPIDLTNPEDLDWMNEEAEDIRHSKKSDSELETELKNDLYSLVKEKLENESVMDLEYENRADEIIENLELEELAEWYEEALSNISPQEDSSAAIRKLDEYVAEKSINTYLN